MVSDPFDSDHLPVVLVLESAVSAVPKPTCRINTREVFWSVFHERLEVELPRLYKSLGTGVSLAALYDEFIQAVLKHLLESGTTRPDGTTKRWRVQRLWLSRECEEKMKERRSCYKTYYRDQSAERKAKFKKVDSEVKIFLRRQKSSSSRAFCESLDPSQGICRIWSTIRALSSRTGALRTDVLTDLNTPEFVELRNELVRGEVPLAGISLREVGVGGGHYAEQFTRREFNSTIAACRIKLAPGLNGDSYEILRKFSDETRAFFLPLFNYMFRASSFPPS